MLQEMKRHFGLPIAVLLLSLLAACGSAAQTGTTSLRGTVTDKSGATVGSAKVLLVNPAQALEREVKTTDSGEYEFLALPPGSYQLTVEKEGFRKYEQTNL